MIENPSVHATRAGYDAIAADYSEWVSGDLAAKPMDRALLAAFAELVHANGAGPVGDLGCGSGRVTAHLSSLGLSSFGVDLSRAMVALARRTYLDLRFDEGLITAVDAADAALGGIVAWYSIIHTPPEDLPVVFAEFHRALAPGGHLLLAFQVGDEPLHLAEAFGHAVSLDFHRFHPDRVAQLLQEAGFAMLARLVREPDGTERVHQAYVLARKPATTGGQVHQGSWISGEGCSPTTGGRRPAPLASSPSPARSYLHAIPCILARGEHTT